MRQYPLSQNTFSKKRNTQRYNGSCPHIETSLGEPLDWADDVEHMFELEMELWNALVDVDQWHRRAECRVCLHHATHGSTDSPLLALRKAREYVESLQATRTQIDIQSRQKLLDQDILLESADIENRIDGDAGSLGDFRKEFSMRYPREFWALTEERNIQEDILRRQANEKGLWWPNVWSVYYAFSAVRMRHGKVYKSEPSDGGKLTLTPHIPMRLPALMGCKMPLLSMNVSTNGKMLFTIAVNALKGVDGRTNYRTVTFPLEPIELSRKDLFIRAVTIKGSGLAGDRNWGLRIYCGNSPPKRQWHQSA